jgi:hypothetical protein
MKDNVLPDTCTFTSIFSVGLFMFACFGQSMRQVPLPEPISTFGANLALY